MQELMQLFFMASLCIATIAAGLLLVQTSSKYQIESIKSDQLHLKNHVGHTMGTIEQKLEALAARVGMLEKKVMLQTRNINLNVTGLETPRHKKGS